jgi:hypothetical protein
MANYRAIANGNWSDLSTWEDDSLGYFTASTSLPTSIDEVYSNNFTVTIDTSSTVNTLRNAAFTPNVNMGAMIIPQMTSNTTPSGVANASVNVTTAWQAFDINNTSTWAGSTNGGWLSYNFPTSRIIIRYGFVSSATNSQSPRTWTFEGSNDGISWDVLDTQTNFTTVINTFYSFTFTNTTPYTFYRINVTAVQTTGTALVIRTLEMSELNVPYGTISNGGGFRILDGGLSLTCISNINQTMVGGGTLLTINTTSGITNLQFSSIYGANATINTTILTVTGASIVNIVGDFMCGNQNNRGCLLSGTATVNLIGSVRTVHYTFTVFTWELNVDTTFNLTGNVIPSISANSLQSCAAIRLIGNCTLNINGNVDFEGGFNNKGNTSSTTFLINVNSTNSNITVNGIIRGGTSYNNHFAITNGGISNVIDHNGILYGGSAGGSGGGNPGIFNTGVSSITRLSGPLVFGDYGCPPFAASRIFLTDNVSKYTEFASNSTNGAAFPGLPPTRLTMYSPDTIVDAPIQTDVRQGVTYALGSQTGSLIVPSPSDVRKGIATDNTVGTADLSAQDMWDYLSSNITTPGSIGEAVLDIKSRTDLIPNNPASVDAVGAIVDITY